MQRTMNGGLLTAMGVAIAVVVAGLADPAVAQRAAPVEVTGSSGNMSPIVENLEAAVDFYQGLLGLVLSRPARTVSHSDVPPPPLLDNQGTPDARLRWVGITIPGSRWGLEVLEFTEIDRKPAHARLQDPGAMTLVLTVRDIDALLATLKQARVPVVTPGAMPVPVSTEASHARAVIVTDPAGHFVELQQPDPLPATTAPAGSHVLGARVRITVADTDDTLRLYRDQLGFKPQIGTFSAEASRLRLMGLSGAQFRVTTAAVPGVPQQILEFIEFKGTDRAPLRTRIQDPGSSRIQLRVGDMTAALSGFKAAGGTVISTHGQPVLVNNVPSAIVREMNNIFVVLQQQPGTIANR
jgi:catechol 2,3-dioxygenase-like lactoylglutathione lyase family enzyme